MIRENQQRYNLTFKAADLLNTHKGDITTGGGQVENRESPNFGHVHFSYGNESEMLTQLRGGQLLVVDSRRRNGLILYKEYHAEFVGPGGAVGGLLDIDCQQVIPVGDLVLVSPESYDERQKSFWIRRHWIRLIEQLSANPIPRHRAQLVLKQFQHYFDLETVNKLPDEAFGRLVGVLPQTVRMVRCPEKAGIIGNG